MTQEQGGSLGVRGAVESHYGGEQNKLLGEPGKYI
jgi:hypothetical protein